MPTLHVLSDEGRASQVPVSKNRLTMGRSRDNDVVLADSRISRRHAEILKTEEGYFVHDLGSYNGTKINGKSIESAPLKDHDEIRLGLTTITFLEDKSASERSADALIITTDTDYETDGHQIVQSSSIEDPKKSQELLFSMGDKRNLERRRKKIGDTPDNQETEDYLITLARSNKVLFVLYEISRNLNQIHDFNELLKKIMDLIFMVIDADYGYLILTGGAKGEELIPVVVKQRIEGGGVKEEIKASRTLIDKVIHDKVALLTSNAMADSRLEGAQSVMIQKIRSAICVPLWRKDEIIGVIQLDSVRFDNQFTRDDLELLKAIGGQTSMVIEQAALNEQILEEERLRNRLERYHSPQIIEMILNAGMEAKDDLMEPKELKASILFTDIVGFTPLSESLPPREINIILNRYFSRMTDIIFSYDGTLDKYIGDAMMAVFGAPMEKKDDAERAIRAALEIRKQLRGMMARTIESERFDIRIGINTGRVVAGNIGSPKRLEYTVIGDPVNIAARLETIAQPNQILIGDETYRAVNHRFKIRKVGPKMVKGKRSKIMVYEVLE